MGKLRRGRSRITTDEGESILEFIQKQVEKERTARDFSQRQLSNLVDRSNNFITRLENGEVEPGILDMIALSMALKKPISYFLPSRYRDKPGETTLEEMKELKRKANDALSKLAEEK